MASTADECRLMVDAAARAGRLLAVDFETRFYPEHIRIREWIEWLGTGGQAGEPTDSNLLQSVLHRITDQNTIIASIHSCFDFHGLGTCQSVHIQYPSAYAAELNAWRAVNRYCVPSVGPDAWA